MRHLALPVALVPFVLVLASCGGVVGGAAPGPSAGPATTDTGTTTTAPRPAPEPTDLTVAATGDFLIHSPVWERARQYAGGSGYDFAPMFRQIKPYVKGSDLALCHVETPMTPRPPKGYPVFNTPPALAKAIASTGWDACDTASNHSLDQGQYGIDQTGFALRRQGVAHTGSFSSAAAARRITLLEARGIKVAFLAYTQVSNGQALPHPWSLNMASASRILADARRARKLGAQVVLVNVHWGDEYQSRPSAAQEQLAGRLAASPLVTAVVGQHVHVVQPIRRVRGRLVVFGEGNLVSNQGSFAGLPAGSQDGYLALLRIRVLPDGRATLRRVDYVPVYVRHPDFTVVPVGLALKRGQQPAGELRASWNRTVGIVGRTSLYGPYSKPAP